MPLRHLYTQLLGHKISISKNHLTLTLSIPPETICSQLLHLINALLHGYNNIYFIIIQGIPPCALPNAYRQTIYKRQNGYVYQRIRPCQSCYLKTQCPGWCKTIPLSTKYSKPLANVPSEIAIEITGHCNLQCVNCTSASRSTAHIQLTTIKKILLDAQKHHVPDIRFTGGEPFLHPDLAEMCAQAKSCGFYVMLNTNATLISPDRVRQISHTTDNVLVSMQGFNDQSERSLTGAQIPFYKKIQNTLHFRSYIPTLRIGTVITPMLIKHWKQYVALIKAIQPDTWALFRPMNPSIHNKFSLTQADYRQLVAQLLRLNQHGISAKIANAMPFCSISDLTIATSTMLGALSDDGNSRLIWDARGFFKPSYFLNKNLGTTITTAWNHPFLQKIRQRSYLPIACQQCAYWSWCRGGSRTMAFKTYRTYFAADPLCKKTKSISPLKTSLCIAKDPISL